MLIRHRAQAVGLFRIRHAQQQSFAEGHEVGTSLREDDQVATAAEYLKKAKENGVKLLMERAIPGGLDNPRFEATYARFREHYMVHSLDTTRPYDGIPELLHELKRRGKKLAIVSNKFYAATQELARHFFPDTIEVAIGERETIRKKPAPDTVLEALRQLGATKEGAVYIGDSDVDIMTAKNSGLPCISVLWGFRDKEFLTEHGATCFAERPEEILGSTAGR